MLGSHGRHRQAARPRQGLDGPAPSRRSAITARSSSATSARRSSLKLPRGLNALWNQGGLHVRAADPLMPSRGRPYPLRRGQLVPRSAVEASADDRRRARRRRRDWSWRSRPCAGSSTRSDRRRRGRRRRLVPGAATRCTNWRARGIASGFGFLAPAGRFRHRREPDPLRRAPTPTGGRLLVGVLNTLRVAVVGIVLATMLGTLIGIGRCRATGSCAALPRATSSCSATCRCCCSCCSGTCSSPTCCRRSREALSRRRPSS